MINKYHLLNIYLTTDYAYYSLMVSDYVFLRKHIVPAMFCGDLFIERYDTKTNSNAIIHKTIYRAKFLSI